MAKPTTAIKLFYIRSDRPNFENQRWVVPFNAVLPLHMLNAPQMPVWALDNGMLVYLDEQPSESGTEVICMTAITEKEVIRLTEEDGQTMLEAGYDPSDHDSIVEYINTLELTFKPV